MKKFMHTFRDTIEYNSVSNAEVFDSCLNGGHLISLTNKNETHIGALTTEGCKGLDEEGLVLLVDKTPHMTNYHLVGKTKFLTNPFAHIYVKGELSQVDAIGYHQYVLLFYIGIHPFASEF